MNRNSDSFVDKIKKFMTPTTQTEKTKRDKQLKDILLFTLVTGTLFLFRKNVASVHKALLESQ